MRDRPYGWTATLRCVLPVVPLLGLTSCVLIVTTSPTALSGATIVFVATDDHGRAVESLHITVEDVSGEWRDRGLTARDGFFRCGVRAGVSRVRAEVSVPSGFVLASSQPWPHVIDVSRGGTVQVHIRVSTSRG